jgi:molybdopterin/thiamine biosynthesis adenylyltransferase
LKFEIRTEQKEECYKALIEFSKIFREEYEREIKNVKSFVPLPQTLDAVPVKESNCVTLNIPLKIPKILSIFIKKKKLVENLENFLKAKNIRFESIKYGD